MKQRGWIVFSGFLWLCMGLFLLRKGLLFMAEAAQRTDSICFRMQPYVGTPEKGATVLIGLALFIGLLKGRFVLVKTVRRMVERIQGLPLPIDWKKVYPPSYWILIATMMGLGLFFRFLPLPLDLRGAIDTAIGSALIHGSLLYFRNGAIPLKQGKTP